MKFHLADTRIQLLVTARDIATGLAWHELESIISSNH